ncbi:MAG: pimeloyl-CoA biosynthesis protein BioC, partial [Actinomycetia bacterium]|nr:pimeloyl-CoA biosynthesis protein BioC [Actinomycetes bacterium]
MSLQDAWNEQGDNWIRWARAPGHDSYWQFHRDRFLELVPDAGRLTLDVGAGEGRLARELRQRGHSVVAIDASPRLARACAEHEEGVPVAVADAARLPLKTGTADLAVAFMSLQDIDDLEAAIGELARVLRRGGHLCVAIVHPINSAGRFEAADTDGLRPFVIRGSYFERTRYADDVERDGLTMRFESVHRPLEAYTRALESVGFIIEALR